MTEALGRATLAAAVVVAGVAPVGCDVETRLATRRCACFADTDGSGNVTTADLSRVKSCIGSPVADRCVTADVDCDGDVDLCDSGKAKCQLAQGADDEPSCCATVVCGACTYSDGACHEDTREHCEGVSEGLYHGDGVPCGSGPDA